MERKRGEERERERERERKPGKCREREREIGSKIGSKGAPVVRVKGELVLEGGSRSVCACVCGGGVGNLVLFFSFCHEDWPRCCHHPHRENL